MDEVGGLAEDLHFPSVRVSYWRMATTFVGIECGGNRMRARHAAVVLHRVKGRVTLSEWSCRIYTDEELLGYLAAEAGQSGVIALHGRDAESTSELMKRIYRVLDYRVIFSLAPKHRTRALVRVDPGEVQRAFGGGEERQALSVLEGMRLLTPAVDFRPLTQYLEGLPISGKMRAQSNAALRAAMAAYAALWCWWHGPAGYDVLGVSTENYRLAPRMMDYEPDTGGA
jgi:hypothetical protein